MIAYSEDDVSNLKAWLFKDFGDTEWKILCGCPQISNNYARVWKKMK